MKLLIGGSPCTHWSIAQTKNRETEPSGMGWDLFENYLIALAKFQPDYFLYENNKSMSAAIRAEITKQFGFEPICINSARVSAQNRQRLYWCGKRNPPGTYSQVEVEQPEDRGILLRDILETGVAFNEKGYTLKAQYHKSSAVNDVDGGHFPAPMAAEPVNTTSEGKAYGLATNRGGNSLPFDILHRRNTYAAEPIRIGTIESDAKNADFDSQQYRVYSPDGKSVTLCGQGGGVGAKTGLYAVPAGAALRGRGESSAYEVRADQKSNSVTAEGHQSRLVIEEPVMFQRPRGFNKGGIKYEKAPTLTANGDWQHNNFLIETADGDWQHNNFLIETADGKTFPVYEVRNGLITIKNKQYPIKLADGYYIIRKLTVLECMKLQTIPEWYVFPVSDTQAYKMLGNGWTVDVIAHLMSHFDGITTEPLDVLSMYDGMACGHIAMDKLGAHIQRYRATEIDKYAIKTACHNFPDIEQLGDAFQVRFWV